MAYQDKLALAQQVLEERERCRTDKFYLAQVLGYDFQQDVHADLFDTYLQIKPNVRLEDQDTCKNRMVLWSRGHYKTYSLHVEAIQLILNFPDITIMLMKAKIGHSKQLLAAIRSHFIGEAYGSRLRELFPEFCEGKRGTADAWTTSARIRKNIPQPTLVVASPAAIKTGEHWDVGFFDDLVHEKNFRNPALVQKAIDEFNLYSPLINPGGYVYVAGTRYVFGDLYEEIISKNQVTKSWKISQKACWTILPDGTKQLIFPARKNKDGKMIGFTLEKLLEIQHNDPAMFSAQYLNCPAQVNRQRFTEEDLASTLRTDADPTFPTYSPTILFVDLNGSSQYYSDDAVILAGRVDSLGRCWVLECQGNAYDPNETVEAIIRMTLSHKPYLVLVEATPAGKFFIELVKARSPQYRVNVPIAELKVDLTRDAKNIRIASLAGEIKNKRLFFLHGIITWKKIVKQFTEWIPGRKSSGNRHDDYPDTVGLMVKYFQSTKISRPVPNLLEHPMFAALGTNRQPIEPSTTPRSDDPGGLFCC